MNTHARTFRFAARFLPDPYRTDTIRLYAFFRTLDDLVDEQVGDTCSADSIERELNAWQEWFEGGQCDPSPRPEIAVSLADIVQRYRIHRRYFLDFLDGMRADLNPVTPKTRADVERYSYQVASTVGLAMTHVFGATSQKALNAATRLGIAMQITNILRDVGGDLARGRMYLPEEDVDRYQLSREEIEMMWRSGTGPDDRYRRMIAALVEWADANYDAGITGISLLPNDVQMPVLVAARLYRRILRQLEMNNYDSLRSRAATSQWQKVQEASRCMVQPVAEIDSLVYGSHNFEQAGVE